MNHRKAILGFLIAALLAWAGAVTAQPLPTRNSKASDSSPCLSLETRQFDFWLGEWKIDHKIIQADGTWIGLKAKTKVSKALDGCALIEFWEGDVQFFWLGMKKPQPLRGMSVRAFDPASGTWIINWMDTLTPRFGASEGGFRDGKGEFFGSSPGPDGKPQRTRITFSDITPTSVNWELAVSKDEGKTWMTIWTMIMKRK